MLLHIVVFLITFCGMEFMAWFSHKYIMHGFLWNLHADHHKKDHDSWFERNDAFFIFYAVVSVGFFLLWQNNAESSELNKQWFSVAWIEISQIIRKDWTHGVIFCFMFFQFFLLSKQLQTFQFVIGFSQRFCLKHCNKNILSLFKDFWNLL